MLFRTWPKAAAKSVIRSSCRAGVSGEAAFSSAGARLGFGKGHYDRALAPVRDRAAPRRVGVCLRDALDPDGGVPSGPLDVPMHAIATEAGVITCS